MRIEPSLPRTAAIRVLTPTRQRTPTAEALTAFCRERLASYKVPARIVFRTAEEFPRTATGKVQKPRLREDLERLHAGGAR